VSPRTAAVALALVTLGVSAGCAASAGNSPATHHTAAKHTIATADSPSATPAAPTAPASTPLGAGQRVWAAFSQRGIAYDEWWAHLRPLLSDSAQAVYVYDDPRKIPAMKLTGQIRVAPKPPAEPRFTAEVVVPTSKGVFRLDLERHTLKAPWLLYAIKFPDGVQ